MWNQYLNCKILHGGTFLQPSPNFSGDFVIPSPQLNEDQKKKGKKVFAENWSVFFLKLGEDQKKRSSPQFGTTFGLNLLDLLVLSGFFSSDHPALKSRWVTSKSWWGDAKSRWEDANSRWGTRPPYNLSTVWNDVGNSFEVFGQSSVLP